MFHKSNFGSFGNSLPADHQGFVPEAGDEKSSFEFDGELDDEEFEELRERAIQMTQEAAERLNTWRNDE